MAWISSRCYRSTNNCMALPVMFPYNGEHPEAASIVYLQLAQGFPFRCYKEHHQTAEAITQFDCQLLSGNIWSHSHSDQCSAGSVIANDLQCWWAQVNMHQAHQLSCYFALLPKALTSTLWHWKKLKEQQYTWSPGSQQRCDFSMKGCVCRKKEAYILIRDHV